MLSTRAITLMDGLAGFPHSCWRQVDLLMRVHRVLARMMIRAKGSPLSHRPVSPRSARSERTGAALPSLAQQIEVVGSVINQVQAAVIWPESDAKQAAAAQSGVDVSNLRAAGSRLYK